MQKIFTFTQSLMNGTVTMKNIVAAFTSRELAERTRQAVIDANKDIEFPRSYCTEITETDVYECDGEVPILNPEIYNKKRV